MRGALHARGVLKIATFDKQLDKPISRTFLTPIPLEIWHAYEVRYDYTQIETRMWLVIMAALGSRCGH